MFIIKIVFLDKLSDMQKKELRISVEEYSSLEELPAADRELVLAARDASRNAYAPYSQFHVGAALRLENGEIFKGNNQENSSFTTGLCAERVALFYANATLPDLSVKSIAVTAENSHGLVPDPVKPCGSCRQAMVETETRFRQPMRIILDGKSKIQVFNGVENLLPFAFKPASLG